MYTQDVSTIQLNKLLPGDIDVLGAGDGALQDDALLAFLLDDSDDLTGRGGH